MFDQKPRNRVTGLVSASAAGSEPDSMQSSNALQPILSSLNAFYRFSRPHTVIGTVNLFNLFDFLYNFFPQKTVQILNHVQNRNLYMSHLSNCTGPHMVQGPP
jgi:hypothetical protein